MQNEMFTKHLSHSHINMSVPPLRSLLGFAGRMGACAISYSFVLSVVTKLPH